MSPFAANTTFNKDSICFRRDAFGKMKSSKPFLLFVLFQFTSFPLKKYQPVVFQFLFSWTQAQHCRGSMGGYTHELKNKRATVMGFWRCPPEVVKLFFSLDHLPVSLKILTRVLNEWSQTSSGVSHAHACVVRMLFMSEILFSSWMKLGCHQVLLPLLSSPPQGTQPAGSHFLQPLCDSGC